MTFDQLQPLLFDAAAGHAQAAVNLYERRNAQAVRQAAISCGSAAELLVRAYIATFNVQELSFGNKNSNLLVSGQQADARDPRIITGLTAAEVKTAVASANTRLNSRGKRPIDISAALQARNASAHMGMTWRPFLRSAMVSLTRVADKLMSELPQSDNDLWGDHRPAIRVLRDHGRDEITRAIDTRKHYGALRLAELSATYGHLTDAVIQRLEQNEIASSSDKREITACPSCSRRGVLTYLFTSTPEAVLEGATITKFRHMAILVSFQCGVCDFWFRPAFSDCSQFARLGWRDSAMFESSNNAPPFTRIN